MAMVSLHSNENQTETVIILFSRWSRSRCHVNIKYASIISGPDVWSYRNIIIATCEGKESLHLYEYHFSVEGPFENGLFPESRL